MLTFHASKHGSLNLRDGSKDSYYFHMTTRDKNIFQTGRGQRKRRHGDVGEEGYKCHVKRRKTAEITFDIHGWISWKQIFSSMDVHFQSTSFPGRFLLELGHVLQQKYWLTNVPRNTPSLCHGHGDTFYVILTRVMRNLTSWNIEQTMLDPGMYFKGHALLLSWVLLFINFMYS